MLPVLPIAVGIGALLLLSNRGKQTGSTTSNNSDNAGSTSDADKTKKTVEDITKTVGTALAVGGAVKGLVAASGGAGSAGAGASAGGAAPGTTFGTLPATTITNTGTTLVAAVEFGGAVALIWIGVIITMVIVMNLVNAAIERTRLFREQLLKMLSAYSGTSPSFAFRQINYIEATLLKNLCDMKGVKYKESSFPQPLFDWTSPTTRFTFHADQIMIQPLGLSDADMNALAVNVRGVALTIMKERDFLGKKGLKNFFPNEKIPFQDFDASYFAIIPMITGAGSAADGKVVRENEKSVGAVQLARCIALSEITMNAAYESTIWVDTSSAYNYWYAQKFGLDQENYVHAGGTIDCDAEYVGHQGATFNPWRARINQPQPVIFNDGIGGLVS